MFDKRELLQERLRPVMRALQGIRFWWGAALILVAATLLAAGLRGPVRAGQLTGSRAALAILVVVAVSLCLLALLVRRSYRDPRQVAVRVERRFPSLGQRLITAVQLPARSQRESLGFLQHRVIEEAHEHSKTHPWADVVSPRQVASSRLAGSLSLLAMAATLWVLASSEPVQQATAPGGALRSGSAAVQIEPGNVELERGTSLLVTARADALDALGREAELVCIAEDGSERRYPMTPTLGDPVLSARVAAVDASLRYQVVASHYQSEVYRAEVFDYPALSRADAELDFPAYTGMPRRRVEDTVRVTAVEGTGLRWELQLNKPVEQATLADADGQSLLLEVSREDPTRYQAEVELTRTQRWQLALVDTAGRTSKFPAELIAHVLPNEPPNLKLVAGGDVSVSPLEEFSVAAEVRDDFGVTRFGIAYQFPGEPAAEVVLGEAIRRGRTQRGEHLFDFEAFGAQPDQLLAYHFWAEDLASDGSPRRVQGDLHFAEVRPLEEIYRENQSPGAGAAPSPGSQPGGGEAGQAEELAELQKQLINATWKVVRRELAPPLSDAFIEDVATLLAGQLDAHEQLQQLASQLSDEQSSQHAAEADASMQSAVEHLRGAATTPAADPLTTAVAAQQAAYQSLLGLRAREFQVSRSRQQQQSGGSRGAARQRQQQLDELELDNDENRYETQSQPSPEETQQQGRQQREVIDRLRELAQRQEDINDQVAQLQSALQLAQSDEEKQELQRQLKRLREQQQEMLRDTDELAQRMQQGSATGQPQPSEQPQQGESTAAPAEQLEATREQLRRAGEALERDDPAEALAAGTRATRQLDDIREELRQQAAGNFDEAMRQIRSSAQTLDERQQEIAEQIRSQPAPTEQPGLRTGVPQSNVTEQLQTQRQRLGQLLQQIEETVQQAEASEPLLAQTLYDSYRHTQQQQVDRKLSDTAELLRRGLQPQAEAMQAEAGEAITGLREQLEQAAETVLGDQTQALERALSELEQLQEQLQSEIAQATGQRPEDQRPAGESAGDRTASSEQAGQPQAGEQQTGQQQSGQRQPGEQAGQPQRSEEPASEEPSRQADGEAGAPGASENGQPQRGLIEQLAEAAEQLQQGGGGGGPAPAAPLTGEGYREWSDRLRDVQQMIEDPALRSEALRIRERAREMRAEFRRHSQPPQWDEVEQTIARPLQELTRQVAAELLRRSADRHAVVPIDRDPVPERFSEAVRRYYESLGSGP